MKQSARHSIDARFAGVSCALAVCALALFVGCRKDASSEPAAPQKPAVEAVAEYDLARILFFLPEVHDVPTEEEAQAIRKTAKRNQALKDEYQRRVKAAQIVENPNWASASNDVAAITVNGKSLLKSQILQSIQLRQHLEQLRKKNIKPMTLKRIANDMKRRAVAAFVNAEIYSAYADEHGITLDETLVTSNRQMCAKSCRLPSFDALRQKLGTAEAAALDREIRTSLLVHQAKEAIVRAANLTVTPEEVAAMRTRFQAVHDASVATNALIYAAASNVYQRIRSREITFEEAVQDFNQDTDMEEDGSWCTVRLNQLEDEPLLAAHLRTANAGDVLPPLEIDNALCIVKVGAKRAVKPEQEEDSDDSPEAD